MIAKKKAIARGRVPGEVSKKDYHEFIKELQLVDVIVRRSATHRAAKTIDLSRKVDAIIDDKASFAMTAEKVCVITQTYSVRVSYQGEKMPLVHVECEFEAAYRADRPMTEAYFEIFKKTSLPLNTWPYWREFVHSSISRMGLPPLLLPMVKRG